MAGGLRVASVGLWVAFAARAQERPSEEELFSSPDAGQPQAPAAEAAREVERPPEGEDAQRLSGPAAQSRFDTAEEKADPLDVGGTLYLRAIATLRERDRLVDMPLAAPALVDAYFDARQSERVRGMLLARMRYDPTADAASASPFAEVPGIQLPPRRPNPSIDLDQLWIRFDVGRAAFLTVGKQHVRWGASRFWNPTDFLSPERKDPLAVFDPRLGANMLKLHVPWEAKGWNFYAIGLLDNSGPANRLGELGGAARAEVLFGQTEVGADAVVVAGRRPRYGFDCSSALGPLDVYGEVALRSGADFRLWRVSGEIDPNSPLTAAFEQYSPEGVLALASGGATFTFNYTEQHAATVGAEYYFNPAGAGSPLLYPWLIYQGQLQPFHAGRHYLGVYAAAIGLPGGLDEVGLTLSNIGNLSDFSFVSRLDAFVRALSYLNVEGYAALHYGNRGGELRFGLDLPAADFGAFQLPAVFVPSPIFELGAGLRVSL
ncbi:MAG: hypothetical protein HYZ28_01215 [Myxococcales bacterium]|nr:hypothetical protein [Myxococcales bacterium]